jgi:branched-chain amino acid transport system permease protein
MAVTASAARHAHLELEAQTRWHPVELVFWAATLLPFLLLPNHLQLASQIAITALFALSLDLILGYAGIVSLGHAAFFGLGAYTAGILSVYGLGDPFVGLAAAIGVAGAFGYATSFVIARFRHLTLIMITLGLGFLLHEAANQASWLTGGSDGLQGVRIGPLLGSFPFDLFGYTAYAYSLIVLFLVFLAVRRLINSPFGLSLRGIRENPLRMPAIGAPSASHIRKVYTIAAIIAGIAGAVLAQTTSTVSLGAINFERSADVLIILVLGGAGRLYGGLIGAIIFLVARDQFSGLAPQFWYFWMGHLLVLVVLFVPGGLLDAPGRARSAWRRYQAEGRQGEFVLRSAGISLLASSYALLVFSVVWWWTFFSKGPSALGQFWPCLLYPTAPCEAASAAAETIGQLAYRPSIMWLGLGCLAAGLLMVAIRPPRAKASLNSVGRGPLS